MFPWTPSLHITFCGQPDQRYFTRSPLLQKTDYLLSNAVSHCNKPKQCSSRDRKRGKKVWWHGYKTMLIDSTCQKINTSRFFPCIFVAIRFDWHVTHVLQGERRVPAGRSNDQQLRSQSPPQRGKQNFVSKLWPQ